MMRETCSKYAAEGQALTCLSLRALAPEADVSEPGYNVIRSPGIYASLPQQQRLKSR